MSKMKEHGIPAFPVPYNYIDRFGVGMTLRDYFAAKAMHAIMSTPKKDMAITPEDVAKFAYEMADAMLTAREANND